MGAKAQSNWDTLTPSASYVGGATVDVTTITADGAYREWDLGLAAGTYTIDTLHRTQPGNGLMQFSLDGVDVGSAIDGYSAGATNNVAGSSGSFTVAAAGKKTLRLRVNGKSGSATNYGAQIASLMIRRTA